MTAIRTVQARVQKSAKLLDLELPGWHKLIDVAKLDMGNNQCIVGQLRNYESGHPVRNAVSHLFDMDNQRGFHLDWDNRIMAHEAKGITRHDFLGQLWKHQIAKRIRCDERKAIDAMFRC